MLTITFHNDGTGNVDIGSYDYKVFVNKDLIAQGRVEEHNRYTGWTGLVFQLSKQVCDKGKRNAQSKRIHSKL